MVYYLHTHDHCDVKRFGIDAREITIEYNGCHVLAILNTLEVGRQKQQYWTIPGKVKGSLRGGPRTFDVPTTEVEGVPVDERPGLDQTLDLIATGRKRYW